jgi:hypothetical protein
MGGASPKGKLGENVQPFSPSAIKTRTRHFLTNLSACGEQDKEQNGLRNVLQKETHGSTTAPVALCGCSRMAPKYCAAPASITSSTREVFIMPPLELHFRVEIEFHRRLRSASAGNLHNSYSLQSAYEQLIPPLAPSSASESSSYASDSPSSEAPTTSSPPAIRSSISRGFCYMTKSDWANGPCKKPHIS